MKPADAKAPKFESQWWKANKAKDADAKDVFADALKAYEKARKVADSAMEPKDLMTLAKALDALSKAAKAARSDSKIGVLQGDTKEALVRYEKVAATAAKNLVVGAKDVELGSTPAQLVKRQSKLLFAQCKKEYSPENFEFLVLMDKGVLTRKVYEKYVAAGSPSQVNVSADLRKPLDDFAAATPSSASNVDWESAPWHKVRTEVLNVITRDTYPRFRKERAALLIKAADVP